MVATKRRSPGFRTLGELRQAARRAVSPDVWGYIEGGAGAERTCRENESAFGRWNFRPRLLSGISSVDLRTRLLGEQVGAPFFIAPMAYQREVSRQGERATAAAAATLRILGVYSTLSSDSLEAIARAAADGPRWFQLYLQSDLGLSLELVRRAERARYSAIVLTVDAPVLGSRDRQARSGFAMGRFPPLGNGPRVRTPPRGPEWRGGPYTLDRPPEASWRTLETIRRATALPVVVKGVLTPEMARLAVEHGARGIVVSNHGGRQLDLAPATLDVLPAIARAVGRRAEVYLDGGVRRGSDIAAALALGARGVGIGRPVLWALAAGGRVGVERYLRLLGTELANTMLLLGRRSIRELDASAIAPSVVRGPREGIAARAARSPRAGRTRPHRSRARSGRR